MITVIRKSGVPSTNYFIDRRDKNGALVAPSMIVIHVGEGSQDDIYNTFTNPVQEKSSIYIVSQRGEVWQLLNEENQAFTQGVVVNPSSSLIRQKQASGLYRSPNVYCIGIENEGLGTLPFNETQYRANGELVYEICKRWNIPLDRDHVIGHREIRSDKTCPGVSSVDKILSIAKSFQNPSTSPANCDSIVAEKDKQINSLWNWVKYLLALLNK